MFKYFWLLGFLLGGPFVQAESLEEDIQKIKREKKEVLLDQKQLRLQIKAMEENLKNLSIVQKETQKNIKEREKEISQKLPLLLALQRVHPLKLFVDPQSGKKAFKGVILLRTLTTSLQKQIQKLQEDLKSNVFLTKDIEKKKHAHEDLIRRFDQRYAELKKLEADKIREIIENEQKRLANEENVNALLDESQVVLSSPLEKRAHTKNLPKGFPFRRFLKPVEGPLVQDLAFKNNLDPEGKGILIEAKKNADVVSPAEGTVVYRGPFRMQDEILILNHGKKVYTIYMGMHKISADVGKKVYAGEKLGNMASYGAGPPKLYFELRWKGETMDPSLLFFEVMESY